MRVPAALLDPADPDKGYGDTKTQTLSTPGKNKTVLERRGYAMSDLIKLTIFVVADRRQDRRIMRASTRPTASSS